jgi:hypothetical protein
VAEHSPRAAKLVEQLRPEEALEVVRELVKHESREEVIAMAVGMIRGYVEKRDMGTLDER